MKLPNGKEVSGRWLLLGVVLLVILLSFVPHAKDMQFRAK